MFLHCQHCETPMTCERLDLCSPECNLEAAMHKANTATCRPLKPRSLSDDEFEKLIIRLRELFYEGR